MPCPTPPGFLLVVSLALALTAHAQSTPARRDIGKFYAQTCAACHGDNLQGGLAPSLLDDQWSHGSTDEDLARIIRDGVPDAMEAYKDALTEAEIRAMVIFLRERRAGFSSSQNRATRPQPTGPLRSERHSFR
ncbi:MAG: hypothetical protein C0502_11100, partial [Opitutus sp.]|nr:hypothetical protein [Opitutus sp.]